ncbi:MAG: M56 family metallopeptidase [Akkermansiaceae bacterium]|nr:M56 family metallopeptidase [Armatimonadota bacterium]
MKAILVLSGALVLATLLTGVGLIAERAMTRFGPLHRSLVCRAALSSLIACLPFFVVGALMLPSPFQAPEDPQTSPLPSAARQPFAGQTTEAPAIRPKLRVEPGVVPAAAPLRLSKAALPARPRFTQFLSDTPTHAQIWDIAAVVYGVVALARLFWLALAYVGTVSLRRLSVPVAGEAGVHRSDVVSGALVAGIRRPLILVPNRFWQEWDANVARGILAHEREHLARRDPLWNLAFRTLEALLWPLPLLGTLRRRHEDASEEIADRAALAVGTPPRTYADCLLRMVEQRRAPLLTTGVLSGTPSVSRRVERLLKLRAWQPLSRRTQVHIGLAALLLALPVTSLTAQTFAVRQERQWSLDERLSQSVSINAEGVPLAELLPLVSSKTGVSFTAGRETADEKVIIFCRARPLRSAMEDIAALFHYAWRETKDAGGKPAYRLERLPRTRSLEERLAREDRNWVLGQMDTLVKAFHETPEQTKKRPARDPVRQAMGNSSQRLAVELYALLTPSQRAMMVETHRVRLPVAGLTGAQKTALAPLFYQGDTFKENPEMIPSENGELAMDGVTPIPPGKMDRTSLSFEVMVFQGNDSPGAFSLSMLAPTGIGTQLATFPAPDAFALPPHGDPYNGTPVAERNLPETVFTGATLADRLKQLAEKTGRPVVADFYRSRPVHVGSRTEIEKPGSPSGKLDALCVDDGYLWWTRGETMLFRKRDWYRQKRFEVSDTWRRASVRQLSARDGKFIAADLQPLAQLTLDQLIGLLNGSGDRRTLGGLPQALKIISAVTLSNAPLFPEPEKELHHRTLLTPPTDARIQPLLAEFADRYTHPDLLLNVDPQQFGFLVSAQRDKEVEIVRFSIDLQPQEGHRTIGYHFQLPLVLPNDRSAETQVSLP